MRPTAAPTVAPEAGLSRGRLDTPVGTVEVEAGAAGLRTVRWLPVGETAAGHHPDPTDTQLRPVMAQLAEYFAGERRVFDLAIDWSPMSVSVRSVLQTLYETVGYGTTVTYGELAERDGRGLIARSIGSVMAANPVPIVVPCHRVVAATGLGGFSGGAAIDGVTNLEAKRWLLMLEGSLPQTLDWA